MTDKKTVPIKKKKSSKKDSASSQVGIGDLNNQLAQMINPSPCSHSNLVPIEVSFIRITHPNGYKEQPKCEFYVGISLATAFRVRKYFCPECKEIIKAPSIYAEEK
jgi:hypothetical protein